MKRYRLVTLPDDMNYKTFQKFFIQKKTLFWWRSVGSFTVDCDLGAGGVQKAREAAKQIFHGYVDGAFVIDAKDLP